MTLKTVLKEQKHAESCVDPQTAVKLLSIFEGRNESAEKAA